MPTNLKWRRVFSFLFYLDFHEDQFELNYPLGRSPPPGLPPQAFFSWTEGIFPRSFLPTIYLTAKRGGERRTEGWKKKRETLLWVLAGVLRRVSSVRTILPPFRAPRGLKKEEGGKGEGKSTRQMERDTYNLPSVSPSYFFSCLTTTRPYCLFHFNPRQPPLSSSSWQVERGKKNFS